MYQGLIPLKLDGSLKNWTSELPPDYPCVVQQTPNREATNWVENHEFADRLRLISYDRGRSSVTFKWKSENTGATYDMSLAQSFALLPEMKDMIYQGKFVFAKRGKNYLLEPI